MQTVVEVTPISSLYVSIYSEMNYQFRSHSFFFLHFTVEGQGTSTRQGPNFGGDVERERASDRLERFLVKKNSFFPFHDIFKTDLILISF